jgi:hypothetical protein
LIEFEPHWWSYIMNSGGLCWLVSCFLQGTSTLARDSFFFPYQINSCFHSGLSDASTLASMFWKVWWALELDWLSF